MKKSTHRQLKLVKDTVKNLDDGALGRVPGASGIPCTRTTTNIGCSKI